MCFREFRLCHNPKFDSCASDTHVHYCAVQFGAPIHRLSAAVTCFVSTDYLSLTFISVSVCRTDFYGATPEIIAFIMTEPIDSAAQGAGYAGFNPNNREGNDDHGDIPRDGRKKADAFTSDHESDGEGSFTGRRRVRVGEADDPLEMNELKEAIKKTMDALPSQVSNDPIFVADFFQTLANTALRSSGMDVPPVISPAHHLHGQRQRKTSVSKKPPPNQGQDQGQPPPVIPKPKSQQQSQSEPAQGQAQGEAQQLGLFQQPGARAQPPPNQDQQTGGAQQFGPFQQPAVQNPPQDSGGIPSHNSSQKENSNQGQGQPAANQADPQHQLLQQMFQQYLQPLQHQQQQQWQHMQHMQQQQQQLQQLLLQQQQQPAITPSQANSGQLSQQPPQQQQPYQVQQQQQPAQSQTQQPVHTPLQSHFGQPFPVRNIFPQANAVSFDPDASSPLVQPPLTMAKINPDPDIKALSKRIHEVKQATSPYESKDDPQLWCDKLLSHASIHKLHWTHLIDHIKFFFEPSTDERVKKWFDSYRDRIRVQQTANMSAADIWKGLQRELISNFDLTHRTRKAEMELHSYLYTNEDPEDYIDKIRDLTRKVNGHATEEQIVKNLYDHLPATLKLHMGPGPWHTKISDFRLGFSMVVETLKLQKKNKPQSSRNPSLHLPATEEEEPQKHYVRNFRRPYSPNCSFCQRGPHKEQECFNMQSVVVKLMGIDPKLTPQKAYDDLIMGIPSGSPAIKAFRDDPDSFMPPSRPRDDRNERDGRYAPRGHRNGNRPPNHLDRKACDAYDAILYSSRAYQRNQQQTEQQPANDTAGPASNSKSGN